jgi:hypothetical protein
MDIKRSGSQPSGKELAEYFTGAVRIDPCSRPLSQRVFEAQASRLSRVPAPHGTRIRSVRL